MKKSGKKISFFKKSGNNHGTPHPWDDDEDDSSSGVNLKQNKLIKSRIFFTIQYNTIQTPSGT